MAFAQGFQSGFSSVGGALATRQKIDLQRDQLKQQGEQARAKQVQDSIAEIQTQRKNVLEQAQSAIGNADNREHGSQISGVFRRKYEALLNHQAHLARTFMAGAQASGAELPPGLPSPDEFITRELEVYDTVVGSTLSAQEQRERKAEDVIAERRAIREVEGEPLVEVGDPSSPTGSRFIPRSEATGRPGRERSPLVSITDIGESELAKHLGRLDAERVINLEDQGQQAFRDLTEISRMRSALESGAFTTGSFSDLRVWLARAATLFGMDSTEIQLIGDAATADTLDAASSRMAVQAAERMGRITNMSLQFIRDSLPALTRTPEGNRILLEVMERVSQREIEIATMADQFIQRHGSLRPEGKKTFFQSLRDLEESDPVITDDLRQRIIDGSAKAPHSFKEIIGPRSEAPRISSQQEVDALPSGSEFIWTDGQKYTKD